jgi:hypothetical protein
VVVLALGAALGLAGCGNEAPDISGEGPGSAPEATAPSSKGVQQFPDVRTAEISAAGGRTWSVTVSIFAPYASQERYANGFRVLSADGQVLQEHLFERPGEIQFAVDSPQPFRIPESVDDIVIEARDSEFGYGVGDTAELMVPRFEPSVAPEGQ